VSKHPEAAFLDSGTFIDSDHPSIKAYARARAAGCEGDRARAIALYGAVRDGIRYDI
jgi:transglutaminase-like putative cysteine protease